MKTKEFIKLIEDADFTIEDNDSYLYVSKVNDSGYPTGLYGRVSKKHEYCFDTNYILFAQLCTGIRGLITYALYAYSQTPIAERESIELLPAEPSKIVIPKFVADWIDAHDLHGNNPLREYRDLEIDFDEGWTNEEDAAVYHWVNENPYAFIDALRYGYEIAKEKLYVVELIDNHLTCWLAYDLVNKVFFMSQNQKEKLNKFKKRFTKQEIKDHDERFWQFAKPVE